MAIETVTLGSKKLLKDVLLKRVRGGFPDEVLIVDNLPFELVYTMAYPMVVKGDARTAHWAADPTQEKVPTLKPGITQSQIDEGIMFNMDRSESVDRLNDILRYIEAVWPREQSLPKFDYAAMYPAQSNSPVKQYSQFPRAVLPFLSPPENSSAKGSQPSDLPVMDIKQLKEELKQEIIRDREEAKKQAARERAAKAREIRSEHKKQAEQLPQE